LGSTARAAALLLLLLGCCCVPSVVLVRLLVGLCVQRVVQGC